MSFEENEFEQENSSGFDLDEKLRKLNGGKDSTSYNPSQETPVVQSESFTDKIKETLSDPKKMFAAIAAIILIIVLIISLFLWGGKKSSTSNNVKNGGNNDPQIVEADKNNRSVFKLSIQSAVDAQEAKGKIAEEWRTASVDYSKNQDLDKFKSVLNKINEERTSYLEKINADDDNKLNTIVINALNNQRQYLNQAFNVKSSGDAISIFNEWNSSDKAFDEEYLETLKSMLNEIGIKFTENKTNNKTTINY